MGEMRRRPSEPAGARQFYGNLRTPAQTLFRVWALSTCEI